MNNYKDVNFERLDNIYRFSQVHMIERESDLTHSARMAMKALSLVNYLDSLSKGDLIDREKLTYKCLIHDLSELFVGDLNHGFKYHTPEFADQINRISLEILSNSGVSSRIVEETDNAKNFHEIYGILVAYFDVESAVDKVYQEYLLQNNHQMKLLLLESNENYLNFYYSTLKHTDIIPKEIFDWLRSRYEYRKENYHIDSGGESK